MSPSLQIGPVILPASLLLACGAAGIGVFIGKWAGRRLGIDVQPHVVRVLLLAVILARLTFVWQYKNAYFESPLDILDIRDGGWDAQSGVIAAWVYMLVLVGRQSFLRKPLLAAVGASSAVWIVGSIGLLLIPQEETRLPTIALPTFNGTTTSLTSFEGKPTVVNLWATWCPPCQREMPALQRAQADHPELHFVFLNQGESSEKVQGFLASRNLTLRNVLLDPKGQAGAQFSQSALPTTLFFDAQGHLVDRRIGELSHVTLTQRLAALLSVPTSKP